MKHTLIIITDKITSYNLYADCDKQQHVWHKYIKQYGDHLRTVKHTKASQFLTLQFQYILQYFQVDAVFSDRRQYSLKSGCTFPTTYWVAPEPLM